MSVIGGYQSDVDLQDINFVGDFPAQNSIGGFGVTTGASDDFELELDPPLTEYRIGLELKVMFNHANVGDARINVNQKGFIPLMKVVDGNLENLAPGDIDEIKLNTIEFDGACFQVDIPFVPEINEASVNEQGIIQIASNADVDQGADNKKAVTPYRLKNRLNSFVNRQVVLTIQPEQINPLIYCTPGRNRYAAINGNLIVTKDIRIRPMGAAQINGHMLNFPKPANAVAPFSHTVITQVGNIFFISIDEDGKVFISGTFTTPGEEMLLNINPYLAVFPLQYDPIPLSSPITTFNNS